MIIDSPIVSGSFLSTGSLSQIGNAQITGSLTVSGSAISLVDGSYSGSGANLFGIPATGITGLNLSQISSGSVSASISPNLGLLINTSVSASNFTGSYTGSLTGIATSASYAAFALTSSYSLGGSGFPFSGSAVITGSLLVSGSQVITGSLAISTLSTGSGVRYVIADADGLISAQTASALIFTTQQAIATSGQTVFPITNGYSTGYVTVFVNGTKLNASEYTDTSGTNIVLATGSMVNDVVEFQKYLPASGVSNNTLRSINYFTTTLGQTNFTVNYTPGLLDVFYNGSKLSNAEYTAANGTSITLATASNAGDTLEVDVYSYQVGAFSGIGGTGVARELAFYNTSNSITGSNKVTYDGDTFSVTGSFLVTGSSTFTNIGPAVFSGSVTAVGGFSGSFSGTATSASVAISSSYSENAKLFDSRPISIFATTGSNGFTANQAITGSLTVTGQIVAQTINVQQVTSSIVYSSGSNIFGCDVNSRQTFTGSFYQTGSVASFSSCVGIGTFSPSTLLHLNGTTTQLTLQNTDGGTNAERIGMFMTNGDTFKILSLNDNNTTRVDNILVANVLNGSIGIGTTPSSWAAPFTAIQGGCFAQHIGFQTNNADMKIGVNNYYNGSNYIYHTTGKQASQLNISADGGLVFSTAACGTAGNAVTWTDAFFITNPGRVGIGIASPVYQLDVCTSNYKSLRIQSSDDALITMGSTLASSQFYSIGVSSNASGQGSNLFWIGASTNNPSGTLTKNLIINCSGNVGIAISPSSNYKLGVTGASFIAGSNNKGVFITDNANFASIVGLNSAISAYNPIELRASGTDYQLYLGTTGNVGIGTCVTSVDKLRVEGSVFATSNMYTSNEGTGFMVDANPAACNARVGLMKYGGYEGMLISGNSTQVRLAHRTDTNFVSGGTPTIRVDLAITPDGIVYVYNLAGSGTRTVTADSSGGLAASSDSSLKQEDTTHQIEGLTEILQLQPRAYKWLKDIEIRGEEAATEIGFFANEVAPIIPSAAPKNHDGLYGFYDRAVIAALVKGMQEQQCTINALKTCIGII